MDMKDQPRGLSEEPRPTRRGQSEWKASFLDLLVRESFTNVRGEQTLDMYNVAANARWLRPPTGVEAADGTEHDG
jgi:hypothetical protein